MAAMLELCARAPRAPVVSAVVGGRAPRSARLHPGAVPAPYRGRARLKPATPGHAVQPGRYESRGQAGMWHLRAQLVSTPSQRDHPPFTEQARRFLACLGPALLLGLSCVQASLTAWLPRRAPGCGLVHGPNTAPHSV